MDLPSLQHDVFERAMSSAPISALFSGEITRTQYKAYMVDVYHYASHSAQVISIAGSRLASSRRELASYLFEHAQEELGHELWARSDLHDLDMPDNEIALSRPSDACQKMLGLEYLYAAHLNAVGLFGWMFALESLGGKAGTGIANQIDQCLNLNGKGIYFLSGHGKADVDHSKDLLRVISDGIKSSEDERAFTDMFKMSSTLYIDILDSAFGSSSPSREPRK
jgi:pyrroloquinoline quinone (PQQ) biosynthesis protein C